MSSTAYLEYSDTEHRYYADGRERRSVTKILDQAGLVSQFCRDEEARYRGSRVHDICADDDAKHLDLRRVPVDLRGYLKAWRRFRKDSGFTPLLIEQRVDSDRFEYAGRFDRLGKLPDRDLLVFADIKTSKSGSIPDYTRLQLVAYAMAFDPCRLFERLAVGLRPDGRYNCKAYPISEFNTDRANWLALI